MKLEPDPHTKSAILSVEDLHVTFKTPNGNVHAVNGVSFDVSQGEVLGIVGESGSGKSVTMMSLMRLLPEQIVTVNAKKARWLEHDILDCSNQEMRNLRGSDIGYVFQDPMTSLNPVLTVGYQLMEPMRRHMQLTKRQARERAAYLLDLAGIPNPNSRLDQYPHQFSGGMRQRVMIAIALACDPKLVIADEPTTALDVTVQAQIVELMMELQEKTDMGLIWITHDLGLLAEIADNVAVMYAGETVEVGRSEELFTRASHPYTKALLSTVPDLDAPVTDKLQTINGTPPLLFQSPTNCSFASRCSFARESCVHSKPFLNSVSEGHEVLCWPDVVEELHQ